MNCSDINNLDKTGFTMKYAFKIKPPF